MKHRYLIILAIGALAALLYLPAPGLAASILGTAANFAVLAGTPAITNLNSTTITGNVGISPAASVTGAGPGANAITFTGPPGTYGYDLANGTALTAKNDLSTAYTALNNMPATQTLTNPELAGVTLPSGVYAFSGTPAAVLLDGTLSLNAQGMNNAYWVFQIPFALTTGSASSVVVTNVGASNTATYGVFWVVGSQATLGTTTAFEGNILAGTTIALGTGATILNGRALAETAEVTMDTNTISIVCPNGGPGYDQGLYYSSYPTTILPVGPSAVPLPATMLLLAPGLTGLAALRKKKII
jgi:hypothetical protein